MFISFALIIGFKSDDLKVPANSPARNPTLKDARPHTNCTDFEGAIKSVHEIAAGEGYLHLFEYNRLHPCCTAVGKKEEEPEEPKTSDIVFMIMTSSATQHKARAVLNSWGRGLENLLLISDMADSEVGSISFDDVSGQSRPTQMDKQHRQIWAMKFIYSDDTHAHLRDKKWYFLADDDTWINIPALLDLIKQYDHRCPVTFGYVWSHVWVEDFDYISGGAGLLMSQRAFSLLTPAFYTDQCPFAHYNDITFGRCAWALRVQIVHHRGFYFDPPERSKDRHEMVWFPPIAEAVSYHYVHPEEMLVMTNYANERWQYTAPAVSATGPTAQGTDNKPKAAAIQYFELPEDFVKRMKIIQFEIGKTEKGKH